MKARASEVFVGRTGELGELERVLEAARAGMGETVLVAGEAGVGQNPPPPRGAQGGRRAAGEGFFCGPVRLGGAGVARPPLSAGGRPPRAAPRGAARGGG